MCCFAFPGPDPLQILGTQALVKAQTDLLQLDGDIGSRRGILSEGVERRKNVIGCLLGFFWGIRMLAKMVESYIDPPGSVLNNPHASSVLSLLQNERRCARQNSSW